MRRQIELVEGGGTVVQETRQYDAQTNSSQPMRGKESAHDYRYFPDPDLPPLTLTDEFIDALREQMPELPDAKFRRFQSQYGLNSEMAAQLAFSTESSKYFEVAVKESPSNAKSVANWVAVELMSYLNRSNLSISESLVPPKSLGQLVAKIGQGKISGSGAKTLLNLLWNNPGADVDGMIKRESLEQQSDSGETERIVEEVLSQFNDQARQYYDGNSKVLSFLVGQVMRASGGKLNAKLVNEEIRNQINALFG